MYKRQGPVALDLSSYSNLETVVLGSGSSGMRTLNELNCSGLSKLKLLVCGACYPLSSINIRGCELLTTYCRANGSEGFFWPTQRSACVVTVSSEEIRDALRKSFFNQDGWGEEYPYNTWEVAE